MIQLRIATFILNILFYLLLAIDALGRYVAHWGDGIVRREEER